MIETTSVARERCLLVGIGRKTSERWRRADSLAELTALTQTAGGEVVERVLQIRPRFDPATLIGRGKVEELRELCRRHRINLLVFDADLAPSQLRNIETTAGVRAIDRTAVILDIFALHAKTLEAKIQVELAQLEYRATMLAGLGPQLSQLGGGIGTRGPGERKLEEDRRRIRDRIASLRRELTGIDRERLVQRRRRAGFFVISLAGYTNAGKSTLMNRLTRAEVKVAPDLFATLDPHTDELFLKPGLRVLLTDTVGFIRQLPHQLVASFRATLGEIRSADLILHLVDASAPDVEDKIQVGVDVLTEIGCAPRPMLLVFNKLDRLFEEEMAGRLRRRYPHAVFVSARTGEGIADLKDVLIGHIERGFVRRTFRLPADRPDLLAELYEIAEVGTVTTRRTETIVAARGPRASLERFATNVPHPKRRGRA